MHETFGTPCLGNLQAHCSVRVCVGLADDSGASGFAAHLLAEKSVCGIDGYRYAGTRRLFVDNKKSTVWSPDDQMQLLTWLATIEL